MRVGKITVCAVVQEVSADLARNLAECADFLLRVADAGRIIWVDEIDSPRAVIYCGVQLFWGQTRADPRIVNGDFTYLRTGLAGKLHRPFPARVGRHEIRPRCAIGATGDRKRSNSTLCH